MADQDNSPPSHRLEQVTPPRCPRCAAVMVQQQAQRGKHAGQRFWGCSRYPVCRGVRPFVRSRD